MPSNSAEYQRAYRLRRKHALEGLGETEETRMAARAEFKQNELRAVQEMQGSFAGMVDPAPLLARIEDLESNNRRLQETIVFLDEEIARLKRELAAQPTIEGEKWERDAWVAEAHKTIVGTFHPVPGVIDTAYGSFGVPRPAPKPVSKKR